MDFLLERYLEYQVYVTRTRYCKKGLGYKLKRSKLSLWEEAIDFEKGEGLLKGEAVSCWTSLRKECSEVQSGKEKYKTTGR
jgi:hypothetical protein